MSARHVLRGLVREGRPRRRYHDALDAGFRLSVVLFVDILWVYWAFGPHTGDSSLWFWCLALATVPALGVNVYGLLTFAAVLRERSWQSAGRGVR